MEENSICIFMPVERMGWILPPATPLLPCSVQGRGVTDDRSIRRAKQPLRVTYASEHAVSGVQTEQSELVSPGRPWLVVFSAERGAAGPCAYGASGPTGMDGCPAGMDGRPAGVTASRPPSGEASPSAVASAGARWPFPYTKTYGSQWCKWRASLLCSCCTGVLGARRCSPPRFGPQRAFSLQKSGSA